MNKGCQEPTIHVVEPYTRTQGHLATELSANYGLAPHRWQAGILDDWLAIDQDGKLVHSYCVLEVPRQNGKTGVSDPRETWGLVVRAEQILHTAQEFQTAKKAFDRLRKKFGDRKNDPFAEYPELNALVDHYTVSAGQMVLDLTNGGHIEFRTRGSNSDMGRGGTFDLVVIDEAQAYTEEQDASLSPLNSAAPSGSPQTILMGTPPLPTSGNKGLVFLRAIESIRTGKVKGACLHEWSTNTLKGADDPQTWFRNNPSLGYQLLLSAIEKDFASMSLDTFAREHLGFMPKKAELQNYAISAEVWDSCASAMPKPDGKTAYGVKFTADGSEVCLCGAVVTPNGYARIELIDRRPTGLGVNWLAEWLNARKDRAACVVIDGKNGVDVLVDKISGTWRTKGSVIRPTAKNVIAAVSMLTDSLNTKSTTWYAPQKDLRESAVTSVKRPISGGWGFGGENSAPIEACALALWGAKTAKRDPSRKMRIG